MYFVATHFAYTVWLPSVPAAIPVILFTNVSSVYQPSNVYPLRDGSTNVTVSSLSKSVTLLLTTLMLFALTYVIVYLSRRYLAIRVTFEPNVARSCRDVTFLPESRYQPRNSYPLFVAAAMLPVDSTVYVVGFPFAFVPPSVLYMIV